MINSLNPRNLKHFLDRFENFNDSILICFSCEMPRGESETICSVELEAKDNDSDDGWSRVTLLFSEVISWKFDVSLNTAYYIMSNGIHIHYEQEHFYLDMSNLVDYSPNISDYQSSRFHFISKIISWKAIEVN